MPLSLNQQGKKNPEIAIVKTYGGIKEALREALDRIGGISKYVQKGERVFVKPNLTGDREPSTGAVTQPEVIQALIEIVYEQGPREVLLGDSPSWGFETERVYEITGAKRVAKETGCTLVNLDKGKNASCIIPQASRLPQVRVARTILDCDKLINVPVMKTHMQTVVSLGLKNMKGILPSKWKTRVHDLEPGEGYPGLDMGIADLHRLIQPDLTIVDATVAMEGRGPFDGDPVQMNTIVAGEDAVLVDAVSASLMGFDPVMIPSIRLCAQNDGIDLKGYRLVGLAIDGVRRAFQPSPTEVYGGENIEVITGVVCTGCLATLNTAMHRLLKGQNIENIPHLVIGVGRNPRIPPHTEKVLLVGTCAIPRVKPYAFPRVEVVQGCPPTGWKIMEGVNSF